MRWEYFGTGLAFLGIGITMVLALPPPWWPKMPRQAVATGLALGLALIIFGVAFIFMGIWPEQLRPRLAPILVICGGLFVVLAGSIWFSKIETRKPKDTPPKVAVLPANPVPPAYAGKIEAEKSEVLLSAKDHIAARVIEIGDSTTRFSFMGPQGGSFIKFAENYELKIELVDGQTKVSTQIRNKKGQLVAELIRNEWKVAPPPKTWDRNYNKNTLEVKDETGNIVLQVRALPDRIQIQGEWWIAFKTQPLQPPCRLGFKCCRSVTSNLNHSSFGRRPGRAHNNSAIALLWLTRCTRCALCAGVGRVFNRPMC
jgi:hypothetical protein